MNPVRSISAAGAGLLLALAGWAEDPPNVILIVADDLGYRDLGCTGAVDYATPNIDSIAAQGVRLTSFYATASIGSPSRASLLTGRYPDRMGFTKNPAPESGAGLDPAEVTLAEILGPVGYVSACFGKWGLGRESRFLPVKQGFEEYFGLPYSNDLGWWQGRPADFNRDLPPIPLIDAGSVIEENPDQRFLTRRYTDQSVRFIREYQSRPFFLYLSYSMPHVPLFVSEKFSGSAEYGLYGDVLQELDWSVGEILKTLRDTGLEKRTLVIFTSDNGPHLAAGAHGGKADPLRDGKFTRYEGGHRVPCLLRWPGKIPGGKVLPGIVAGVDLFSTIAAAAGADVPATPVIDGLDMTPYLTGKAKESPRTTFFYSRWAVRHGKWKLMLPGGYREEFPKPKTTYEPGMVKYEHSRLFDLEKDVEERHSQHEDEDHAELLKKLAEMCFDYQGEIKAGE